MIIDEIDDPMFSDIVSYYNHTKAANLTVIGLTATAFDGNEEGNEVLAIEKMKYKVYYNTEKNLDTSPEVNETMHIGTKDAYEKIIRAKCKTQPILIYADSPLFE